MAVNFFIHQIELTSHCNLTCDYCVHRNLARVKQHMPLSTFRRALHWVKALGAGSELNLSGIGEPMLWPHWKEGLITLREAFPDLPLVIPTNGLLLTDEKIALLVAAQPVRVFVSLHRAERALSRVRAAKRAGILAGVSLDALTGPVDWAGNVDWEAPPPGSGDPCPWLVEPMGFVAADGNILTCCFDATGESRIAHVDEAPRPLNPTPWYACSSCRHKVP